jgi:hypothetical protein
MVLVVKIKGIPNMVKEINDSELTEELEFLRNLAIEYKFTDSITLWIDGKKSSIFDN